MLPAVLQLENDLHGLLENPHAPETEQAKRQMLGQGDSPKDQFQHVAPEGTSESARAGGEPGLVTEILSHLSGEFPQQNLPCHYARPLL